MVMRKGLQEVARNGAGWREQRGTTKRGGVVRRRWWERGSEKRGRWWEQEGTVRKRRGGEKEVVGKRMGGENREGWLFHLCRYSRCGIYT
jgi:hypothetical protein